jgi:uncharacterized membrane protein YkoI
MPEREHRQPRKGIDMPKFAISAAALAALMLGGVAQAKPPVHPTASHAASHAPKARVTMAQARATALRAAPGKVISSEYENEGGGWRYSFDIQQRNNVQEIGIDGQSGKIVENKSEGPKDRD